jgi:gas vesicle protein
MGRAKEDATMYREEQSGASFMLGMLTGAFVGAGIALLFAPRSGQEIRQQLGEQYRDIADRVGERAQGWRNTAGQLRGQQGDSDFGGQLSDRTSGSERQSTGTQGGFPSSAPTV